MGVRLGEATRAAPRGRYASQCEERGIVIGNLQVLRFLAATGVVVLHSNAEIMGRHTEFYGVAVFFVLSGYVMSMVSDRSASSFMLDRMWRIIPAYWIAMAIFVIVLKAWNSTTWTHIILSALFIPHEEPNAGYFPALGVGWTLNMEMYFYTVFAIAILIRRKAAPAIAAVIVLAIAWILPLVTTNGPVLHYYTHEYLYYFVFGIAAWYVMNWLAPKLPAVTSPRWVFPLAIAVFAALTLMGVNEFVIVPALVLAALLTSKLGADIQSKQLLLLGAASYGCYLLHTILLSILRAMGIEISGSVTFTLMILIVAWTSAVIWYLTVERGIGLLHRRSRTWRRKTATVPVTEAPDPDRHDVR